MLTPENFICKKCGKCCIAYTVKLSDEDIKRIESLGFKKIDFAVPDDFDIKAGKYALKRTNNQCIFLEKRKNGYFCKIYGARPEICSKYPFIESDKIEGCEPEKGFAERKK
jgi:Fe-S-cluster containining protein